MACSESYHPLEAPARVGLGLPIVLRIVEGHQGQVDVRGTEGRGTTFTVRLPCAQH